jgi:hypothetical protein
MKRLKYLLWHFSTNYLQVVATCHGAFSNLKNLSATSPAVTCGRIGAKPSV